MKLDIVNEGKEFKAPALGTDMETILYLDLLKMQLDVEKEFATYAVPEPPKNPETGKYGGDVSKYLVYQQLLSQKANLLRLTRILQSIDPNVTSEKVSKKGLTWINQTLKKIYNEAPDRQQDFPGTAAVKDASLPPNSSENSQATSTEPQS